MKTLLWLGDFRNPKDYFLDEFNTIWGRNYNEFYSYITKNNIPDIICFDHDLGEEKSGYDYAKFLVKYC